MIAEAETMLLHWGQWQRGHSHLGYGSLSVIGRCMAEGAGASHSTVKTEPHMPPSVEIVELYCLTLGKPLLRAVKHRFIGLEPDEIAARKLHVTVDIYQTRINQAIHNLVDYLVEN